MNNRKTGAYYETLTEKYIAGRGFEILERNFRCRLGEIDLIAKDGDYLVFVEVKYRGSYLKGHPEEAVTASKQKTIYRTAQVYMIKNGYGEQTKARFDVAAVYPDETVKYYKNAFGG